MRVVARELGRYAEAWESAAGEVERLVGVLDDLDPNVLGEAAPAAVEFVSAVVWWAEQAVASARRQASALWAWSEELTETERAVAARFAAAGGGSW